MPPATPPTARSSTRGSAAWRRRSGAAGRPTRWRCRRRRSAAKRCARSTSTALLALARARRSELAAISPILLHSTSLFDIRVRGRSSVAGQDAHDRFRAHDAVRAAGLPVDDHDPRLRGAGARAAPRGRDRGLDPSLHRAGGDPGRRARRARARRPRRRHLPRPRLGDRLRRAARRADGRGLPARDRRQRRARRLGAPDGAGARAAGRELDRRRRRPDRRRRRAGGAGQRAAAEW